VDNSLCSGFGWKRNSYHGSVTDLAVTAMAQEIEEFIWLGGKCGTESRKFNIRINNHQLVKKMVLRAF